MLDLLARNIQAECCIHIEHAQQQGLCIIFQIIGQDMKAQLQGAQRALLTRHAEVSSQYQGSLQILKCFNHKK